MNFEAQEFYPSSESLKIVEKCVNDLAPENLGLQEWHDNYVSNHKERIALDLDIAREKVSQGSHVLEFGSVPLIFTAALIASGYQVTGVDIAPERYQATIDHLNMHVVKCDIEVEALPFEDDSFDSIIFNELFEHLRINPIFTLSEVLRVMKPGGTLMLSTPNLRSLRGIINFLVKNRAYSTTGNVYKEYQKLEKLGHMGHVREYTTREVTEFLENVGFTVKTIIYRGHYKAGKRQMVAKMIPSLRPLVSYVAHK